MSTMQNMLLSHLRSLASKQASGAFTGRALPGLSVEAAISNAIKDYKDLPWDVVFIHVFGPTLKVRQKADREGRFRLDGLLPGVRYNLALPLYREGLMVEPGKTKDLGDFTSRPAPEKGAKEKP